MHLTFIILSLNFCCFLTVSQGHTYSSYEVQSPEDEDEDPLISDPRFKAELIFKGIKYGTAMEFLGPNDVVVLQKQEGTVQRIVNGVMMRDPVLQVQVSGTGERGLLGIAFANNKSLPTNPLDHPKVFVYFTEIGDRNHSPVNRLYMYDFIDNKLTNRELVIDIHPLTRSIHNGGVIRAGPDGNIYVMVGSQTGDKPETNDTMAMNAHSKIDADGKSGILRFSPYGEAVADGIIGSAYPLNLYYAYGIRNSFGLDFDPVTGKLWDTENGPLFGDEINLVEPGFNSGWKKVQGVWEEIDSHKGAILNETRNLVDFSGRGKYSSPEFVWEETVGVTSLAFLDTQKYGKGYENDLLVADINNGNIYHFELNPNRTGLALSGTVKDKVLDSEEEIPANLIFGKRFSGITDMKIGPDGYLYVLTYDEKDGSIYRINFSDE